MSRTPQQVLPPLRKTLLEWITVDDADQPEHALPVCAPAVAALHARIASGPDHEESPREPLAPPPGFGLAPLG